MEHIFLQPWFAWGHTIFLHAWAAHLFLQAGVRVYIAPAGTERATAGTSFTNRGFAWGHFKIIFVYSCSCSVSAPVGGQGWLQDAGGGQVHLGGVGRRSVVYLLEPVHE